MLGCDGSSVILSASDSEAVEVVPSVRRSIFARPDLLFSFPNPMGFSSTGTAEFGIVIINPTDKDIFVNQVSIQIIPNKGGDLVFKSGTTTSISPATGTWASANNIIFWQDLVNPIKIASLNGTEYIVTTELLQISSELTTHPINTLMVSVFSSYGQFGQGPFTTGFSELVSAVVSVYMNKTADSTTAGGELYVVDELESSKAHKFIVFISKSYGIYFYWYR